MDDTLANAVHKELLDICSLMFGLLLPLKSAMVIYPTPCVVTLEAAISQDTFARRTGTQFWLGCW